MEFSFLKSLIFLLPFLYYFFAPFFFRKLQNLPPSPLISLPFIGHLYLLKKPLHRTLAAISEKHSPVLLLQFGSRPVLLVSSASAAEECFTKNDIVFANRPKLLAGKHLGCNYSTMVFADYGDHWRNLRRIASTEMLSANRIQMMADIRRSEVRELVMNILRIGEEDAGGGYKVIDVKTASFGMMTNIMMRMIGGKRYYGNSEDVRELEERRRFKEIVKESFAVSGASNMVDFLPILKWIGVDGLELRMKILQEKRDSFMQDLIQEQRSNRKNKGVVDTNKTLIDVLLSLQEADHRCYTDGMIRAMMQVLLTAGTDTSASTMEWAMALLLNNPEALIKAQTEIDKIVGHTRLVQESDLPQLPYLRGLILETMRMYPVAPLLVAHESLGDCRVGGYRVPGGTMLLVNAWAIHNDGKLWEEPRKFKPERFVDYYSHQAGQKEGFVIIPFGYGRRGCPGENLAMRVMGLMLGTMIQCFDWARVGKEMVDMTEGTGLTMPKAKPLVAKCRPRPSMDKLLSQL